MKSLMFLLCCSTLLCSAYHPFTAARERSRAASCIINLKQIGLGCMLYANDHNDRFPPVNGIAGLQMLIDKNYLTDLNCFSCPAKQIRYSSGKLDSSCPYLYVGAGGNTGFMPNFPLVIEKPGFHRPVIRVHVLFADGRVEAISLKKDYREPAQIIDFLAEKYRYSPEIQKKLRDALK